jgi:predicted NAD-dependent protein-ADP-ribosyltransferase YbiA (DUF1768 family)
MFNIFSKLNNFINNNETLLNKENLDEKIIDKKIKQYNFMPKQYNFMSKEYNFMPKKYNINGMENYYVIGFNNSNISKTINNYCNASYLSNFVNCPNGIVIYITGHGALKFKNAEAAFQALKYPEEAKEFIGLSSFEVLRLKNKFEIIYPARYGTPEMMYEILVAKFRQNPTLAKILLETDDAFLIEHSFRDDRWSNNGDGTGDNILGLLLMKVRYIFILENIGKKLPVRALQSNQYKILPPPFTNINIEEFILKGTETILNIIKQNS